MSIYQSEEEVVKGCMGILNPSRSQYDNPPFRVGENTVTSKEFYAATYSLRYFKSYYEGLTGKKIDGPIIIDIPTYLRIFTINPSNGSKIYMEDTRRKLTSQLVWIAVYTENGPYAVKNFIAYCDGPKEEKYVFPMYEERKRTLCKRITDAIQDRGNNTYTFLELEHFIGDPE